MSGVLTKFVSVIAVLASGATLLVSVPKASAAPTLSVVSQQDVVLPVNGRTATDYTLDTHGSLATTTKVRVMLPRNYDASGATRYPVLYLLHGGAADYQSWTALGGVAQRSTNHLDLITVMPDAGRSAWYTDWYNNGRGGPPMWETYHINQLIPWVDATFNTIGSRSGRAIAGLSSGGFGAMSYASRHPDLFVTAAAFSGAVDTNTRPVLSGKVIDALALQDRGIPGSSFGIRETEEVRWRGRNPWDLAPNLENTTVAVRTGNGMSGGKYGGGGFADPGGYALEKSCHDQTVSFHQRMEALGIPHVYDNYGPGTHSFPYWNESLEKTLPMFMATFGTPDPETFSYRAIEPSYDIYRWNVQMHRSVLEFSYFEDVDADGFTLRGSGSSTVTSAPIYEAGRAYDVTIGGEMSRLVADQAGRLVLEVPLGPENLTQQYFTPSGNVEPDLSLPAPQSPTTTVYSTEVSIVPVEEVRDTTPPAVEISSGPEDGSRVRLKGRDEDVTFGFAVGEDATTATCSLDGTASDCLGASSKTYTVGTGDHTFRLTATDAAGNVAERVRTFSVSRGRPS